MKRRNKRSRKIVETQPLEQRSLLTAMTAFSGSNLDATLNDGVLTVNGTNARDQITISEMTVRYHGPRGGSRDYVVASMRDADGDLVGMRSFNKSSVTEIHVNARGGDDTVKNNTDLPSRLRGERGNDQLEGGSGFDWIDGGRDNDRIYGKSGDDTLGGSTGNDTIYGGKGNDTIDGGSNRDSIFGGSGNDVIDGGASNDVIRGDAGDDTINGGLHNDWIYGGDGDDKIDGDSGDDVLYGQNGKDRLFGDTGNDWLNGGANADGLFGGHGVDTLTGGTGGDRFLVWYDQGGAWQSNHDDTLTDLSSIDAEVQFIDTDQATVSRNMTRKAWYRDEIETLDQSLAMLMDRTGNTDLLKKANGGVMKIKRFGHYTNDNDAFGSNDDSRIAIMDETFSLDSTVANYVLLHEVGHFHDESNENARIDDFQAISGWRTTRGGRAGSGEVESLQEDDNWVFQAGSRFVSVYGMYNPVEDWAESFATNMMVSAGLPIEGAWADLNNTSDETVAASVEKMDLLDQFFADFS